MGAGREAGSRRVEPRPRRLTQAEPQQPDEERDQRRARRPELEPELQRRVMRMQRQPGLVWPDRVLTPRNRSRRIETPAGDGPLGDPIANEGPYQQPMPG